jgi:hypothetical protein
MLDLSVGVSLLDRYKVLNLQGLKIYTTVIAPNVRGQQNTSLPWSMEVRRDADVGAWMNDRRHISVHARSDGCSTNKFKCSLLSALAEGKISKDMVDRSLLLFLDKTVDNLEGLSRSCMTLVQREPIQPLDRRFDVLLSPKLPHKFLCTSFS